MAQIFQNNRRHRHAQSSRKILDCHGLLFFRVGQEVNQALSQILRTPRFIKLNRQLFTVGHLAEIGKIGAYNRNAVSASQMRHATATSR
jgi:hypothetical protein